MLSHGSIFKEKLNYDISLPLVFSLILLQLVLYISVLLSSFGSVLSQMINLIEADVDWHACLLFGVLSCSFCLTVEHCNRCLGILLVQ